MNEFKALINGKLITSKNKISIIGPDDLKIKGEVPALIEKDINKAFLSARKSQNAWEDVSLSERIKYINKFKQLLINNKKELAALITAENSKPLKDSLVEVERTAEYIEYTIEEAKRLNPETYLGDGFNLKNKIGIFKRVAKGVVLAISPFNYPVNLSISKIAPALVTGNTVVYKPATNGSLSGTYLASLFYEANFPKGVINVVTGRGSNIGDILISHPEIDLISFTGSVEVGKSIKKHSNGVDLVLELGGKDPMLVLPDADLDKAANDVIGGGFSYSGQRCTAIKLIVAHENIADKLVSKIKPLVEKLTVGKGFDNNFIVPLINIASADFVQELNDDALAKGAKLIIGNKRKDNLFYPTIIDYVTLDMKLSYEEPFGPIIPIVRVKNKAEMISVANNSKFGLQASIYTNNLSQAFLIADKLNVGTVNFNSKSQRGPDSFPFLGVKNSGHGVQGIKDTLLSVTRPKGYVINY